MSGSGAAAFGAGASQGYVQASAALREQQHRQQMAERQNAFLLQLEAQRAYREDARFQEEMGFRKERAGAEDTFRTKEQERLTAESASNADYRSRSLGLTERANQAADEDRDRAYDLQLMAPVWAADSAEAGRIHDRDIEKYKDAAAVDRLKLENELAIKRAKSAAKDARLSSIHENLLSRATAIEEEGRKLGYQDDIKAQEFLESGIKTFLDPELPGGMARLEALSDPEKGPAVEAQMRQLTESLGRATARAVTGNIEANGYTQKLNAIRAKIESGEISDPAVAAQMLDELIGEEQKRKKFMDEGQQKKKAMGAYLDELMRPKRAPEKKTTLSAGDYFKYPMYK